MVCPFKDIHSRAAALQSARGIIRLQAKQRAEIRQYPPRYRSLTLHHNPTPRRSHLVRSRTHRPRPLQVYNLHPLNLFLACRYSMSSPQFKQVMPVDQRLFAYDATFRWVLLQL